MLNLTNGFVLGAGKINAVGNCTLGKLVGTAVDMIFLPGITWCCTMLVTVAAGSAAMAAAEIPDKVKAASLGANTVNTLLLHTILHPLDLMHIVVLSVFLDTGVAPKIRAVLVCVRSSG